MKPEHKWDNAENIQISCRRNKKCAFRNHRLGIQKKGTKLNARLAKTGDLENCHLWDNIQNPGMPIIARNLKDTSSTTMPVKLTSLTLQVIMQPRRRIRAINMKPSVVQMLGNYLQNVR